MSDPHQAAAPTRNGYRLTPDDRVTIAARVLAGQSKTQIAKDLDLARSTVTETVKRLQLSPSAGESDIRERLSKLNTKASTAIERSLDDETEPHKAAGTAIAHLKGMGVYAADVQANVVIAQQIGALPEDWRGRYISNTSTPQDVVNTPESGAVIDAENS